MKIKVYNLYTNKFNEWIIPSKEEALEYNKITFSQQYDRIEREVVYGGLPCVFKRVQ